LNDKQASKPNHVEDRINAVPVAKVVVGDDVGNYTGVGENTGLIVGETINRSSDLDSLALERAIAESSTLPSFDNNSVTESKTTVSFSVPNNNNNIESLALERAIAESSTSPFFDNNSAAESKMSTSFSIPDNNNDDDLTRAIAESIQESKHNNNDNNDDDDDLTRAIAESIQESKREHNKREAKEAEDIQIAMELSRMEESNLRKKERKRKEHEEAELSFAMQISRALYESSQAMSSISRDLMNAFEDES